MTTSRLGQDAIIGNEDKITLKLKGGASATIERAPEGGWRINGQGRIYTHLRDARNALRSQGKLYA